MRTHLEGSQGLEEMNCIIDGQLPVSIGIHSQVVRGCLCITADDLEDFNDILDIDCGIVIHISFSCGAVSLERGNGCDISCGMNAERK